MHLPAISALNDLTPGSLVGVTFGGQREVREIDLLATPGSVFTFADGHAAWKRFSQTWSPPSVDLHTPTP